jgi:hypothetical protein
MPARHTVERKRRREGAGRDEDWAPGRRPQPRPGQPQQRGGWTRPGGPPQGRSHHASPRACARRRRHRATAAYRSVSFSLFLPPSPWFVLLTSLRSAQANTHAFIFCLSQIFIRPRINSHPTLFFYLSRIGKSFPKRVLIRKKPQANSMAAANALLSSSCLTSCLVHYTPTNYQLVGSWCVLSSFLTAPAVHQRGGASVRA